MRKTNQSNTNKRNPSNHKKILLSLSIHPPPWASSPVLPVDDVAFNSSYLFQVEDVTIETDRRTKAKSKSKKRGNEIVAIVDSQSMIVLRAKCRHFSFLHEQRGKEYEPWMATSTWQKEEEEEDTKGSKKGGQARQVLHTRKNWRRNPRGNTSIDEWYERTVEQRRVITIWFGNLTQAKWLRIWSQQASRQCLWRYPWGRRRWCEQQAHQQTKTCEQFWRQYSGGHQTKTK